MAAHPPLPRGRPGPVSANVKLDLRKAYLADRYGPIRNNRHQRRPISVAATVRLDAIDHEPRRLVDTSTGTTSPGAELIELLCAAVTAGHLDTASAALIGQYRIADVTADEIGASHGLQPQKHPPATPTSRTTPPPTRRRRLTRARSLAAPVGRGTDEFSRIAVALAARSLSYCAA